MTTDATDGNAWLETFYQNLQALVDTTFPKTCPKCEHTFSSQEAFLKETMPVHDVMQKDHSGLFSLEGKGVRTTIGVFRNCTCGTTLMADFMDRRDTSERGKQRRAQFDLLLDMLTEQGVASADAGEALQSLLQGMRSKVIEDLLREIKAP